MSEFHSRPVLPDAESFLLLKENRFAHTAVERLQHHEAHAAGRMVFLYGPSGVGKTVLADRLALEGRKGAPRFRLMQTTAAAFAAEFAEAVEQKQVSRFQETYRSPDVFICEDLSALENRHETQQQLAAVLDDILSSGGRCLLTCRRSPGGLTRIQPKLINRCHSGVCAPIRLPDAESRGRLLAHFARCRQIPITSSAIDLLAQSLPVSPRELLSTLLQLEMRSRLSGVRIERSLASRYLESDAKPATVTLSDIARAVARQFDIGVARLRTQTRSKGSTLPRHCAMFLARELTEQSLGSIARYFGHQNHSAVAYARQRVRQRLEDEPSLRLRLEEIRRLLGVAERGCL